MEYLCISRTWDGLHEALNEYGSKGWTVLNMFFDNRAVYKIVFQRTKGRDDKMGLEWGDFVSLNDPRDLGQFVDLMGDQIKASFPILQKFDQNKSFTLEWKIRQ